MTQSTEELKARVEREGMRKSIERAFDQWWAAPNQEKPTLLLNGPLLTWGERWLMMHPGDLPPGMKNFILRSIAEQTRKYSNAREMMVKVEQDRDVRYNRLIIATCVLALLLLIPSVMLDLAGLIGGHEARHAKSGDVQIAVDADGEAKPMSIHDLKRPAREPQSAATRPPTSSDGGFSSAAALAEKTDQHLATLVRKSLGRGERREAALLALELLSQPASGPASERYLAVSELIDALQTRQPLRLSDGSAVTLSPTPRAVMCRSASLIVAATANRQISVLDAATGRAALVHKSAAPMPTPMAFDRDCGRWIETNDDYEVVLRSATSSGRGIVLGSHDADVISSAFSADGTTAVTVGRDGRGQIFDTRSGRRIARLTSDTAAFSLAALSHNGDLAVIATDVQTAEVWDTRSGRRLAVMNGHEAGVSSVRFTHDTEQVMTVSLDGTARLWDGRRGVPLAQLKPAAGSVIDARLSADGRRTALLTDVGQLQVWDNARGVPDVQIATDDRASKDIALSMDGRRVAIANWSGLITVWLGGASNAVIELNRGGPPVSALAFTVDGRGLQAVGLDGELRLWSLIASEADAFATLAGLVGSECFSSEKRVEFGLAPRQPDWCSRLGGNAKPSRTSP